MLEFDVITAFSLIWHWSIEDDVCVTRLLGIRSGAEQVCVGVCSNWTESKSC